MVTKFLLFTIIAATLLAVGDAVCKHGILEYGVSPMQAQAIVEKHNEIRLRAACGILPGQPKAANLKALKYSASLARKAQEATNNCLFNPPQITGTEFAYVGRNSFLQFSTVISYGADWNATLDDWLDKHKTYNFDAIGNSANTGLYTQLVWANTEYVGCGYTLYMDSLSQFPYNKLYICAYGPAGNIIGETPYIIDNSGSGGCSPLL
ncbi:hypothetical protein WA026_019717 [Henosepilachna vigintioctopunctata]|uniref:SCP domain-containing protein n=1 Tax=Henosepilachna vigintioctopunctata TaxID=420089 RepID=A0AAW1UI68_9CUCU